MTHDEEMAQLLSVASHDVRGPLTALQLGARLLGREKALSEAARQFASELEDSADDLQRRILDALDLSRALHGALNLVAAPLDLADCCRGVVHEAERQARTRSQVVRAGIEDVFVLGDARLVPRAVHALLDHAIQASPPGAMLTLDAAPRDAGGLVRVVEAAGPFDASQLEHVFDVAPSDHGKRPAGGIALAFARAVAVGLGGRVWAENEGNAAALCLWLPQAS